MKKNIFEYIENIEKNVLLRIATLFKDSLEEFSTSMDRSLNYIDKIIFPLIMASKEKKSFNPFSEIIEKYTIHILTRKFEKDNYKLLPLGYSSDLTLENENYILNIDIKTANLDNPSDFNKTINIGINQTSHIAKLKNCNNPIYVYPNLPPCYNNKLILTYGLMFIYPPYKDLLDDIRKDYEEILEIFKNKINLKEKEEIIAKSLMRGVFIHKINKNKILKFLEIDYNIYISFKEKLESFIKKFREKDIKPIATIIISIPNGILYKKYIDKFVSGKTFGESARFHYKDGYFEILKEKQNIIFPRVIFIDINKNYINELKKYFNKIHLLKYEIKSL